MANETHEHTEVRHYSDGDSICVTDVPGPRSACPECAPQAVPSSPEAAGTAFAALQQVARGLDDLDARMQRGHFTKQKEIADELRAYVADVLERLTQQ